MSVKEKLTAIADAIRGKTGRTQAMTLEEMALEIEEIVVAEPVPAVEQAEPVITLSAGGLITASVTQEAGQVEAGTKTATRQLTVQGAQTITPGAAAKTIPSGRYLTGTQTILGDSSLVPENIVSGAAIFGVAGTAQTGGGDGDMDALIDRSVTQVQSNAEKVGQYAFYGCSSMTSASFPQAERVLVSAFYNCSALETVYFPQVTALAASIFEQCFGLKEVEFPLAASVSSRCFYNCNTMTRADFGAASSIAANAFNRCAKLAALILRSESLVSLAATSAFTSSAVASGSGYVYVPAALVDSYRSATNWSTYADQIRAIEDYPEITGG